MSALTLLQSSGPVAVADVEPDALGPLSHELAVAHGARLADLFGDEREDGQLVLRVVYALDRERRFVVLQCPIHGTHFPSLSDLDPAAFVEECEIYEQYGVRPDNGQPLNRVFVPPRQVGRSRGWVPTTGRRRTITSPT